MTLKVAIVGGGAIGSAIASFVAGHPKFSGEVCVVERDPSYKVASSALSGSAIRQQFSTPVNIELSRFGIAFLRTISADIGLREPGYLFLATGATLSTLQAVHRLQRQHGVEVALLEPKALSARFPWLSTEGIAAGSLGLSGEGWFDGYLLLQAFRRRAVALGVKYLTQEATGFVRTGGTVNAVVLGDGSRVPCDVAVNAAGPWAASIAAMLDIELPVRARRRTIFVFACRDAVPDCPLVIDPSGVYFRPEGAQFIGGTSPKEGEADPDDLPLEVDYTRFDEVIWPALARRVPVFQAVKVTGGWSGYYELNTLDHNGIVGPHPAFSNVFFANGFSGHGLQHAPGVGRGIAELIVDGGYRTLDLSPLSFDRILARRPLHELNVI
ncbi:MAG TPA: FAD-dependent oxidoreductase [bacterium]|nr:FAD-dependent oxidoreductase [bacterium]